MTKDVVAENPKDIEAGTKGQIRYPNIDRTRGRHDTGVIFEAPNGKVTMNLALKRADRMEIETLVAVSADEQSPAGSLGV